MLFWFGLQVCFFSADVCDSVPGFGIPLGYSAAPDKWKRQRARRSSFIATATDEVLYERFCLLHRPDQRIHDVWLPFIGNGIPSLAELFHFRPARRSSLEWELIAEAIHKEARADRGRVSHDRSPFDQQPRSIREL